MREREEIEDVAENARIALAEDEIESLGDDFEGILASFESLDEIDTEGVEPSLHPVDIEGRERDDIEEKCLARGEAFDNTENEERGFFVGPGAV